MYTLAQIIQAEAGSDPAGGFAVASTIQNRAQSGLFGTSDPTEIVNQPGQFAGSLTGANGPGNVPAISQITSQNQAYADAIQNGTLSQFGNTGNALYFQSNQGQASTVVGGSSANIGGNYFSNRMGQPDSAFVAPQFGGAGGAGGANDTFDGVSFDGSTTGGIVNTTGNTGGESFTTAPDGSIDISQFSTPSTVDFGDLADNTFDGAADPAAVASGAGGAAGAGIAGVAGGGIAVDLTDPTNVAINAGKDIQAGAGTVGQDVQTSAGGIAGTAASILNSFEAYTSRAFVVAALVLLGALFIAFGLGMFGKREAASVA